MGRYEVNTHTDIKTEHCIGIIQGVNHLIWGYIIYFHMSVQWAWKQSFVSWPQAKASNSFVVMTQLCQQASPSEGIPHSDFRTTCWHMRRCSQSFNFSGAWKAEENWNTLLNNSEQSQIWVKNHLLRLHINDIKYHCVTVKPSCCSHVLFSMREISCATHGSLNEITLFLLQ